MSSSKQSEIDSPSQSQVYITSMRVIALRLLQNPEWILPDWLSITIIKYFYKNYEIQTDSSMNAK